MLLQRSRVQSRYNLHIKTLHYHNTEKCSECFFHTLQAAFILFYPPFFTVRVGYLIIASPSELVT